MQLCTAFFVYLAFLSSFVLLVECSKSRGFATAFFCWEIKSLIMAQQKNIDSYELKTNRFSYNIIIHDLGVVA